MNMDYSINIFVAFPSAILVVLLILLVARIAINLYERYHIKSGTIPHQIIVDKSKRIIKYSAVFALIAGIIMAVTSPITTVKYEQKRLEIDTSVLDAEESAGEASQASRMPVPKHRENFVHNLGKK